VAVLLTRRDDAHSAEQKEQQLQLPAAVFTLAATLSQAGAADAGAHHPGHLCLWSPSPLLGGQADRVAWQRLKGPEPCGVIRPPGPRFRGLAPALTPWLAPVCLSTPAVSPSLKNLLLSVLAGGSVLLVIAAGVVAVSNFDKLTRKG
jgi:hypothetical protein